MIKHLKLLTKQDIGKLGLTFEDAERYRYGLVVGDTMIDFEDFIIDGYVEEEARIIKEKKEDEKFLPKR